MKNPAGRNIDAPVRWLCHSGLRRYADSLFRSACPACESGLLLVSRNNAGELQRRDRCVLCGQAVYYLDDTIGGVSLAEPVTPP